MKILRAYKTPARFAMHAIVTEGEEIENVETNRR